MSSTPEQRMSVRGVLGVNRIGDARVTNPAAPWTTQNKFGRDEISLSTRPGSRLIINGKSDPTTGIPGINVSSAKSRIAVTDLSPGGTLDPGPASQFDWVNSLDKSVLGMGARPGAMSSFRLQEKLVKETLKATRVAGLSRIYFDLGIKRKWVGAWNFGGNGDRLFYINEDESGYGLAEMVPFSGISSIGANFYFVPYRYKQDGATDAQSFFAIGTNQLNYPFAVKNGNAITGNGYAVDFESLIIGRSDEVSDTPGTDDVADTVKRMYACRALTVYNGVMVYAGYRMRTADGSGDVENRDNCFTFADFGTPHMLATVDTAVQYYRAGDTEAEECTAAGTTVVETDQVGAKNQLVIFTAKRLALFEGIPPSSENAAASDALVTYNDVVGCNAPRSVVTTPYGLVFLGTDGCVYLIPRGSRGQVIPISRKIQPAMSNLSLRQQNYCAAVWDPDGFYKLSIPGANPARGFERQAKGRKGSNVQHHINAYQWWADMRNVGAGKDLGVKWFGPMTGMKHSCMALAWGAEDRGEIFAGSAVDGSIFEVNRYDRLTDPNPQAPTEDIPFEAFTATGWHDLGDAHKNKRLTGVSLGVSTNRKVAVEIKAVLSGPSSADEQGEKFEKVVTPQGPVLGSPLVSGATNPFTVGQSRLAPGNDLNTFTDEPTGLLMGKMMRFEITEHPAFQIIADVLDTRHNHYINFVANSVTYAATVAAGIYSGEELAEAVQTALNAQIVGSDPFTVTYAYNASIGQGGHVFTIAYGGAGNFQLLFSTGLNAANDPNILMGYTATNHTGAVTYTSDIVPPDGRPARVTYSDFSFDVIPSNRRDP